MCGYLFYKAIDKIIISEEQKIDKAEITHKARGPDNFKKLKIEKDNAIFYFRRLSIIGMDEKSNQPLEIENFIIMFNGEIYNYESLKQKYLNDTKFYSKSDTEVILRLYIKYGFKIFSQLSGIYSILIYDRKNKKIITYRDPFGIKPLYYLFDKKKIIISSQARTISKIVNSDIDMSSKGIYDFLGNLISKDTIYKNIYSFEPGKINIINESNNIKSETLENIFDQNFFSKNTNINDVKESLYSSIRENLVSDVEVSLLFSSGFDSNIIAENLPDNQYKLFTISTIMNSEKQNEIKNAEILASFHGKKFISHEYKLNEIIELKKMFFNSMDLPTIDGLNTFLTSHLINKHNIKVALSGVGGDEYFGTYDTFRIIPNIIFFNKFLKNKNLNRYIKKIILKFFNKEKIKLILNISNTIENLYFSKRAMSSDINKFINFQNILEEKRISKEIFEIINLDCSDKLKITLLELKFYCKDRLLRDIDWASMSNSIEVRVPFLNKSFHRNICAYMLNSEKKIYKSEFIKSDILKKKLKTFKKQGFYVPYIDYENRIKTNQSKYGDYVLKNFR